MQTLQIHRPLGAAPVASYQQRLHERRGSQQRSLLRQRLVGYLALGRELRRHTGGWPAERALRTAESGPAPPHAAAVCLDRI